MAIAHIDESRLEADAAYRFQYLCEFIGFGPDDIDAIHAAAPLLAPLVPTLVDAVYDKLFAYDSTPSDSSGKSRCRPCSPSRSSPGFKVT